ncbi:unnamed protein product, partial [Tetraodon nigroviridis]
AAGQQPVGERGEQGGRLGQAFKQNVRKLREKSLCLDLVFLVDESSSVGASNFLSELRFIRKMLSDFPVAPENTRVALVTFSSKTHVVTRVDHISAPKSHQHKCSLFNKEIPAISYRGGGTYTKGAFQRAAGGEPVALASRMKGAATWISDDLVEFVRFFLKAHIPTASTPQQILRTSRTNATKVIFLITDGYSNGGDPRPVAAALRERGVEIFTLGIWQGNIKELHDMASEPKEQHCYLVPNFAEFEALARHALHEDLPTGSYIQEDLSLCSSLCEAGKDCCDLMASCKCGTHTGQYDCICEKGYYGKGLQHECTACPPGTYKPEAAPGGPGTCLACPDAPAHLPARQHLRHRLCVQAWLSAVRHDLPRWCTAQHCHLQKTAFLSRTSATIISRPPAASDACPSLTSRGAPRSGPPSYKIRSRVRAANLRPAPTLVQPPTSRKRSLVAVQVKPVYAPPQLFPIGNETITYIATDHSGNQANCSFAVTVVVQAADIQTAVVWEVPQFSDNSGGRLTLTSSHTPGSQFPVGETLVQYTATDAAGNSRTCNLTITVQGKPPAGVMGTF